MCHIIINSLSLNKVIHQLGSTACCHGTCLIFGANKNWSFKSPCEVRALKFFPIKHLLIPDCAPQLVTLTQNIFIIKRSFEISAHRFQRRIITGKSGTIKSLLQITLSCSWWNQNLMDLQKIYVHMFISKLKYSSVSNFCCEWHRTPIYPNICTRKGEEEKGK